MTYTHLDELSAEAYRAWFDGNRPHLQQRSPFHLPAWLDVVKQGLGFDVRIIGIYQGRTLVGAVPGFVTRVGPASLFGSPLKGSMTSYLGPVSFEMPESTDHELELMAACSAFARRRWRVIYTRFTLRDAPPDHKPEIGPNWLVQRAGSYRLNLGPGKEQLWRDLGQRARRSVRKAERLNMTTMPLTDARLFYTLLQDTLTRHGSASFHSQRFFNVMLETLIPHDLIWAWGTTYEGRTIAAGLFLHDEREAHHISGGSMHEFGSLPTSYLLYWNAIAHSAEGGLSVFNSDASRVTSIDQFKETFGLGLQKRLVLTWAPAYIHAAQKAYISSYSRLRRARSVLLRRAAEPI